MQGLLAVEAGTPTSEPLDDLADQIAAHRDAEPRIRTTLEYHRSRLATSDGTIWAPGDSRLIREHHLTMPAPDAMLFDFSDSDWHFGLDGAIQMASTYPDTPLLLHHWGCVDAPDFPPFNADPASLSDRVINPDRITVLAPGEPFTLRPLDR